MVRKNQIHIRISRIVTSNQSTIFYSNYNFFYDIWEISQTRHNQNLKSHGRISESYIVNYEGSSCLINYNNETYFHIQ